MHTRGLAFYCLLLQRSRPGPSSLLYHHLAELAYSVFLCVLGIAVHSGREVIEPWQRLRAPAQALLH